MAEVWKPFRSGVYEVSSLGRVRRVTAARGARVGYILNPTLRKREKRWEITLFTERRGCPFLLAVVVAETFLGPRQPQEEVNHKDGNKQNDRSENLEYVTRRENTDHALLNGLYLRGAAHPAAKLTPAHVLLIRKLGAFGSQREIGQPFGVGREAVKMVLQGKNWAHV